MSNKSWEENDMARKRGKATDGNFNGRRVAKVELHWDPTSIEVWTKTWFCNVCSLNWWRNYLVIHFWPPWPWEAQQVTLTKIALSKVALSIVYLSKAALSSKQVYSASFMSVKFVSAKLHSAKSRSVILQSCAQQHRAHIVAFSKVYLSKVGFKLSHSQYKWYSSLLSVLNQTLIPPLSMKGHKDKLRSFFVRAKKSSNSGCKSWRIVLSLLFSL